MKKVIDAIRIFFSSILFLLLIVVSPIVLIALGLATIPCYFIDNRKNDKSQEMEKSTIDFIKSKSLGYYISIQGIIRSGKTALSVFISNVLVLVLKSDIQNKIDFFRRLCWKIDFNELDNDILELKGNGTLNSPKKICRKLYSKYKNFLDEEHEFGNKIIKGTKYFKGYVRAIMREEDNHYVLSSTPVYCPITDTNSLDFKPSMLELKERAEGKDYQLTHYLIALDDDKGVQTDKNNKMYFQIAKEDKGSSLFYRLMGNMMEESFYYITTAQSAAEIVLEERRLANSIITIYEKCHSIGNYQLTRGIIHSLVNSLNFLNKVYSWCTKEPKRTLKKPNQIKEWIYNLFIKDFELDARGYVFFPTYINYGNKEDIKTAEEFNFVASKEWSFDCYETHAFQFLHEILEEESTTSFYKKLYENVEGKTEKEQYKEIMKRNNLSKEKKKEEKVEIKDTF